MRKKLPSYLRTERRRKGFTQDEIAYLLGCASGTNVSRFERLSREPNLETAFACQAIFGVPAHELFPGIYKEVEKNLIDRARLLREKLKRKGNAAHKRVLLEALLEKEGAGNDPLL